MKEDREVIGYERVKMDYKPYINPRILKIIPRPKPIKDETRTYTNNYRVYEGQKEMICEKCGDKRTIGCFSSYKANDGIKKISKICCKCRRKKRIKNETNN